MAPPVNTVSLPPSVQAPEFEGPLDLLLEEVRRQNVAIEQIAMAPIVARFLEYFGAEAGQNLNLDIEWLHMAATLIYWKSRALLPLPESEDPQKDPIRDDLISQLLAHRKQAADELARRRAVEEARFTRSAGQDQNGASDSAAERATRPEVVSVWDLIQQARELAGWVEQQREDRCRWQEAFGVEQDETTVSEMMEYLREKLASGNGKLDGIGLLGNQATASRRSCLFLGMLEMAGNRQIELLQNEVFGPLFIRTSAEG
jgi:segregation and condensation protein A